MRKHYRKSLVGQKFGKLTVIEVISEYNRKRIYACQCDCGNPELVPAMGCGLKNGKHRNCGCEPPDYDLIGQTFGKLTVVAFDKMVDRHSYWLCKCSCEENKIISVKRGSLKTGNTRSCGCIRKETSGRNDWTGFVNHRLTVISYSHTEGKIAYWNCKCECSDESFLVRSKDIKKTKSCGCWKNDAKLEAIGDLSKMYMKHLKSNASKRDLEFSVSQEYLWNLFVEQGGLCALTNIPLKMEKYYLKNRPTHTASLDRIDNDKGYVEGNVRWVHWRTNLMKNDMADEELIYFCKKIVKKDIEEKGVLAYIEEPFNLDQDGPLEWTSILAKL